MIQRTLFANRLDAWRSFHKDNPHVFELFLTFARQARQHRNRFGARMVFERIRWYSQIETNDPDFVLNNNHFPYYARLAMLLHPAEFTGFFEVRLARTDATDAEILEGNQ